MTKVVGIFLAAGGGSRFAGPGHKLFASLPASHDRPAEPVVVRSFAALVEARLGPIVIVTGAVDITECLDLPDAARTVHNPAWADGQMTSVRRGLEAAREIGAERVVVGLGDQPGITGEAWRAVAASDAAIAVATYDGRRGNPVALQHDVWELLPESGDEGARSLMRLRPDLVGEVPCTGSPADIDTEEDLRRWQNSSSTNSP